MIETWSPIALYVLYVAASGATAVSSLYMSGKKVTVGLALSTAIFHGLIGGALGMQVFEARRIPWTSLLMSTLYGAGIVQISRVTFQVLSNANTDTGKAP